MHKKVTISISEESWNWWQENKWLNLSGEVEKAIRRIRKEV